MRIKPYVSSMVVASVLFGCGAEDTTTGNSGGATNGGAGGSGGVAGAGGAGAGGALPDGLPELGSYSHDVAALDFRVIVEGSAGLATPRDLAFNPEDTEQLWVVNMDSSVAILTDVNSDAVQSRTVRGSGGTHFFARASGIAFGSPGTFATSPEQDEETQPSTPVDFMGPTLWTSDLDVYNAGHAGHLDMLHNSPNSAGIAWEQDNAYWVFDGMHASLTHYDFKADHGPGGADHSDGEVLRYVAGEVGYVEGVPSHLEYSAESGRLFVADSGNQRVAVLDTTSGKRGKAVGPNYDGGKQWVVDGASLVTLIDGAMPGGDAPPFTRPSGLAIQGNKLYIGDNASSVLYAFALDGSLLDWVDLSSKLQPGGLMGIATFGEQLFIADAVGERVIRIQALPAQ